MVDAGDIKTEKLLDSLENKLDKIYSQAEKETKKKYLDYAKKTKAKEKKKLSELAKGKITQDEFNKWKWNSMITEERYRQLTKTMAKDLAKVDQKAMSIVNGYLPEAYALNANYATYQMNVAGVDFATTFQIYDRHTVERLARSRKAMLPKPKVDIPKDERWNMQKIRNAITQGVLQGEAIPKIAKRLEKVVGMDRAAAIRNARTAMTGAQNAGRIDSYNYARKELGINVMKEWQASGDGLTRESHAEISGERVKMNETFSNGCEYPGDPGGAPEEVYNCRCTLLPYLPDYDFKEDQVGGEKEFDDWLDGQYDDERKRLDDAIANAQEYSYEWHEENDFDWDKWLDLEEEYRQGIVDYTDFYYEKMNEAMRNGDISMHGSRIRDKIVNAYKGMEHFELPTDEKLYRGMGSVNSLARALGISKDEVLAAINDGSLVGMRFVENGFGSTAANWDKAWHKPVMLDIVAPQGTKGMYVDLISENSGEREILLQSGTEFEILDVGKREHGRSWWNDDNEVICLKVVVTGVRDLFGIG